MRLFKTEYISLTFVFSLFLLFSCNEDKKSNYTENKVVFDTINTARIHHMDNDSTQPYCSIKLTYMYPTDIIPQNKDILRTINEEIKQEYFENATYQSISEEKAVDQYINNYFDVHQEDLKASLGEYKKFSWNKAYYSFIKIVESKIIYNRANILSYQIKSIDTKAGKTPYVYYRNLVFDMETGEKIREKDIFKKEYKHQLAELLKKKLLSNYKLKKAEDLQALGFFDLRDLSPNSNFSMDEEGLTYIYNTTEIASEALGQTKLFLSYKELAPIIKTNSSIQRFITK